MNGSKRDEDVDEDVDEEVDEEVENESTQTILTESSNPASIEMRLCTGRISLLQAKVHELQEENRLLNARSRYGPLPDSGCLKQETFQKKIPLEIRKLIWQYSLSASRIIQFTVREDDNGSFFSGSTPPVALHICSESRQEALSIYRPFFAFDHEIESASRPIYFCPARDILYFAETNALRDEQFIHRFPEVKEIQSLALDYNPYNHYFTRSFDLRPFHNLTELILVVRYPDEPVFEFRCCGSMTFFDLDSKRALGLELMERWEALEDVYTEALGRQCPKGTTPIVRVVRIGQIPQTPCYANLEYTGSEPPSQAFVVHCL
jgi:hypothetical protein